MSVQTTRTPKLSQGLMKGRSDVVRQLPVSLTYFSLPLVMLKRSWERGRERKQGSDDSRVILGTPLSAQIGNKILSSSVP